MTDHQDIENEQTFRQPSAGIHVVAVHHIGFTVIPHQNWHLIFEREYIITIKLYDRDNNEIFNTDVCFIFIFFLYFEIISSY